ncbi:MAG: ankyrin repeat domain-containing protein, partial [Gammaproteobacteria bacterium]|nr:ankyrin repeat domain-containing protein [Gammaproteobacteria bacterium]
LDILKCLLDHENNLNLNYQKNDGWTLLHIAVVNGHFKMVEELLKRGADPHLLNDDGDTPLMLSFQHEEMMQLFEPYVYSPNEKNIELAKKAIEYCRLIVPTENSSTQPLVTDPQHVSRLGREIVETRARKLQLIHAVQYILMYSPDSYLHLIKKNIKKAKQDHVGNCGELSEIAINFLRKNNIQHAEKIIFVNGDHAFVVIDRQGKLDDPATWGDACIILDILNNAIFTPAEIYAKLKNYLRFDFDKKEHLQEDLTIKHKLAIAGEITSQIDEASNQKRINDFHKKLANIEAVCYRHLNGKQCVDLSQLINKIKAREYHLKALTNFEIERLLDKKIKQVLNYIRDQSDEPDDIYAEIMANELMEQYPLLALHQAVDFGHVMVVEKLLRFSFDTKLADQASLLALHLAAKKGNLAMVQALLDYDNQVINHQTNEGWTALAFAVDKGHLNVVDELLKQGANPYLFTQDGLLALHLAARNNELEVLKYLLDHEKNINLNYQKNDGWTLLHIAVSNGYFNMVEELLKRGADPHLLNADGNSPLMLSLQHEEIMPLFESYVSSSNEINKEINQRRLQNIELAEKTIEYCRLIVPTENSSTQPLVTDPKHILRLFDEIGATRARKLQLMHAAQYLLMYSPDSYLHIVKENTKKAKQDHFANCGELSEIAINFLRKNNIQHAEKMFFANGDHEFVVIDRQGELDDPATWGDTCIILDILSNAIFTPAEIYTKLKNYLYFDFDKNEHLQEDFTSKHKLAIQAEIKSQIDEASNQKRVNDFHKKLDNIEAVCYKHLNGKQCVELSQLINTIKAREYHLKALTNFEIERLLDKKLKQVLNYIRNQSDESDDIYAEIMANELMEQYPLLALHQAVNLGHVTVVEKLLRFNFDTKLADQDSLLALHLAAKKGNLAMVQALLGHDNQVINHQTNEGWTALAFAVDKGHL